MTDGPTEESSNTPSKSVNPWLGKLRSGSPNVLVGSVGSKTGSVKGKEKVDVFDAVIQVLMKVWMKNSEYQLLEICSMPQKGFKTERLFLLMGIAELYN